MNCFKCDSELLPVHDSTDYQFDNALWIGFFGGYGMFVDNLDADHTPDLHADFQLVLCHDCAHTFMDENPFLKKLFHPFNSHSHTAAYMQKNPDHFGWDVAMHHIQKKFPGQIWCDSEEFRQAYEAYMDQKTEEDYPEFKSG